MIKPKTSKQRLLPIALLPLFSMAVLVGCGSDDDDDGPAVTPDPDPVDPTAVVGDADGNGVPDAFETLDATADANGNGIADVFETPTDPSTTLAADTNANGVDDSFEASLTGGADADGDGVDDAAAAAAAGGGTVDPGTPDPDPGGEPVDPVEPVDQTGQLNDILIGFNENNAGTGLLNFDGTALSGMIEIAEGVQATGASINTGIPAGGPQTQVLQLNGSSPTFFLPSPIGPDESAVIAENITSGNLFLQIDLANGGSETGPILLTGVTPIFSNLDAESVVPAGTAFSSGQGNMNINTVTGDFTAVVTFVNLNPADVDADGNPQTISGVSISNGAAGETGGVIVELNDAGGGAWTSQGTFSPTDLATVTSGNANFTALGTDGSAFLRGQIPGQ